MHHTVRRSVSRTAVFVAQHPEVILFALLMAALAVAVVSALTSMPMSMAGPATGGNGGTG